jgi:hypothetical protein
LWYKESSSKKYKIHSIKNRNGESNNIKNNYLPFSQFKAKIFNNFITSHHEIANDFNFDRYSKNVGNSMNNFLSFKSIYEKLKHVQPSSQYQKPFGKKGTIIEQEYEWCNDEESGYELHEMKSYVSFELQVRYVVFKK